MMIPEEISADAAKIDSYGQEYDGMVSSNFSI